MSFNIVVLGATGFIGRNIAEYLSTRYPDSSITGVHHSNLPFNNKKIKFMACDLRTPEGARRALEGADIVIQAAATTSGSKDILERPYIHVTDNAVMNVHLLQAAFELKIKHFLFFSCSVMYPSADKPQVEVDFIEPDKIHPRYFGVAQTKLYIESLMRFYAGIMPKSSFTAIRHTNIFGPWDKYDLDKSHVCGASIAKVLNANEKVTIWGTGEEARDLLYVEDLCSLVDLIIQKNIPGFQLVNAGMSKAISVKNLVEKIIHLSGKKIKLAHDLSRPTIPTSLSLDCAKARELYNWYPKQSLEQGLQKTLDWCRRNAI